jgi:WD40 repeat protein
VYGVYDKSAPHGTVKIWDRESLKCTATLSGHTGSVSSVFAIDNIILSGSYDKTVKVWDRETFTCTATLSGHIDFVNTVFAIDNIIISGSWDYTIKIWDRTTLKCTTKSQLIVPPEGVRLGDFRSSIEVYPQVSINRDFSSSLGMCNAPGLDKSAPHCTATLTGHTRQVDSVVAIDNIIISNSWDNTVKIWERETYTCIATFEENIYILSNISAIDNIILFGLEDGNIRKVEYITEKQRSVALSCIQDIGLPNELICEVFSWIDTAKYQLIVHP